MPKASSSQRKGMKRTASAAEVEYAPRRTRSRSSKGKQLEEEKGAHIHASAQPKKMSTRSKSTASNPDVPEHVDAGETERTHSESTISIQNLRDFHDSIMKPSSNFQIGHEKTDDNDIERNGESVAVKVRMQGQPDPYLSDEHRQTAHADKIEDPCEIEIQSSDSGQQMTLGPNFLP